MCNGMILANGEYCPHERRGGSHSGDCDKGRRDFCRCDAEYCEICETWFDENNKCDCSEEG